MVILACGDRNWTDRKLVTETLEYYRTNRPEPLTIVEGGARGADRMAGQWAAAARKKGVGWVRCSADWARYGKPAGHIRNQEMLDYLLKAENQTVGVLAFHDDITSSRGTRDMVTRARLADVPVRIITH